MGHISRIIWLLEGLALNMSMSMSNFRCMYAYVRLCVLVFECFYVYLCICVFNMRQKTQNAKLNWHGPEAITLITKIGPTKLPESPSHPILPPRTQYNQNTTWLCWYFDWTFEASGGWRYKWCVVDNVNTLWLDWACWVAKGQGGAHCWLFSKDSPLKFVW